MLIFGLKVASIGLGVVFGALLFLVLVINVITTVTNMLKKSPVTDTAVKKPEAAVQKAAAVTAAAQEDESDVLAVISAAIACLSKGKMAVRTITRIGSVNTPSWSAVGRQENMNLRQI